MSLLWPSLWFQEKKKNWILGVIIWYMYNIYPYFLLCSARHSPRKTQIPRFLSDLRRLWICFCSSMQVFWGGPSAIPVPKGRRGKVSAHWESHQTAKCCGKIHSKKAIFLSFEKLAKIHSTTALDQGVAHVQNEGAAAGLDAPTYLFFWGSRTPDLCHERTKKLHSLSGKTTRLGYRAVLLGASPECP